MHPLARKIFLVLFLKIVLLFCLWKLFFSEPLPIEAREVRLREAIVGESDVK
jgi:hypothetical protein